MIKFRLINMFTFEKKVFLYIAGVDKKQHVYA